MPPRRALRPDAEVAVSGHVEPLLLHGGRVVKTLSVVFLADFEQHWRTHGKKVLDILAEKYPQAYFGGAVALAKTIRWDTGTEEMFDGAMTPEEIMDKLEQRVGPKGRKLFEQFLRKVNQLQAQQAIAGAGTVRSIGPSNCSPLKQRIVS
jgi:hypothetical protein